MNIFSVLMRSLAGPHFCTRYWFRASSLDRLDLYQVYLKMGLKISLCSGERICEISFHGTNYFLLQPSFFNMVLVLPNLILMTHCLTILGGFTRSPRSLLYIY